MQTHEIATSATPPMVALKKFTNSMGVSDVTVWRWRKDGWLTTINICGRPYVTAEAIEQFKRRAAAGEFAKEHKHPASKA